MNKYISLFLSVVIFVISCTHTSLTRNPSKNPTKTPTTTPELEYAYALQKAFIEVAESVRPAVVGVSIVQVIEYPTFEFYFGDPFEFFFRDFDDFFRDFTPRRRREKRERRYRKHEARGVGSGVIISPDGYILTNEHVIRKADKIKIVVYQNGRTEYEGKVVGKDERTDLAVIKINPKKKLIAVKLGDSDKVRVGEWVLAIGSPFGLELEQTVTAGIISARRQSLVVEGRRYRDFLQTDAAINRGNSGGPLCNLKGEVIGINTAIYAPTGVFAGVGFAIPINRAKEILDDLIKKGKVVRGWLGVEIQQIDDAIMKQFGLPDKNGALVNSVFKDSPAEKAGLKRGDVIREFNNIKIESVEHLQDVVSKTQPEKKVPVKIIRDKKEMTLYIVTGELPEDISKLERKDVYEDVKETYEWEGLKVSNLTEELAEKYEINESAEGVVVIDVEYGSLAGEIGLQEGDLIRKVNRESTPDVSTFKKVISKVKISEGVVFDITRRGKDIFISYMQK